METRNFSVGKKSLVAAAIGIMLLGNLATDSIAAPKETANAKRDIGRDPLPPNNGWAAFGPGTTGGSDAPDDHVYVVTNKQELIAALGTAADPTPRIIYVSGTVDLNVDSSNVPCTAQCYAVEGYNFEEYLATYDPDVWGTTQVPSGPLEDARKASEDNQKNATILNIRSNTTLVGFSGARIQGGGFVLNGVQNVIIRNIDFEAPVDYFPQWDPTDGSAGNWNSQFDALGISNSTQHVWIDHNTLSDGRFPDSASPDYYGRKYQQHDGLLDITNSSNYVTASFNIFKDHDKVSIIGSSDSRVQDRGTLKTTIHHNWYRNLKQRLPRVRYGQVDVYNNYYDLRTTLEYSNDYAWGVGTESGIYAQYNYFDLNDFNQAARIIRKFNGTDIFTDSEMVNGLFMGILAAYNNANPTNTLGANVGWVPQLRVLVQTSPDQAKALVEANAGAGVLKTIDRADVPHGKGNKH